MRKLLTLSVMLCLFLLPAFAEDELAIAYLGHSCFTVTAADGTVVMIDPYASYVPYPALPRPADVLLVTHEHVDHNAVDRVEGNPTIVRGLDNKENVVEKEQTIEAIPIESIAASHGPGRGNTALFVFVVDGVHFAHLGDIGTLLSSKQAEALCDVEVLFIPVGGKATIDASKAVTVIESLSSVRVVIPMHYFVSNYCPWPFDPVDTFLDTAEAKWPVFHKGVSQVSLSAETLPEETEVWVLEYER